MSKSEAMGSPATKSGGGIGDSGAPSTAKQVEPQAADAGADVADKTKQVASEAAADAGQVAVGAIHGAVKGGGLHGAAIGAGKSFLKTKTGKRTIVAVLVVSLVVSFMTVAYLVEMAQAAANIPQMVVDDAVDQVKSYIHNAWSSLTDWVGDVVDGSDDPVDDVVDDYQDVEDDAPWSMLFALEDDTLRTQQGSAHAVGPYGVDMDKLRSDDVSAYGPAYESGGRAYGDECLLPPDLEESLTDHPRATAMMACLIAAAMHTVDPMFSSVDFLDGVEQYSDDNGDAAYRVIDGDPAAAYAKEVFTDVFASLPIPDAAQRAPRLYDVMIRAALGILQSCGDLGSASGMVGDGTWSDPVQAPTSDAYGMRLHPVYGDYRFHAGEDLAAPCGTQIHAAASGTVLYANWSGGYGGVTRIDHGGGIQTWYAHQEVSEMQVAQGDQVSVGQVIGLVNTTGTSTGCHLHFEVHVSGTVDQAGGTTVDPTTFMAARGVSLGQDPPIIPGGGSLPSTGTAGGAASFSGTDSAGTTWTFSEAYQITNARAIIDTGHSLGASDVVITAALGTAMIESHLSNLASNAVPESLNYQHDGVAAGDHDSVGAFQQRPSQGWGTVEQIMDGGLVYQSTQFYNRAIPMAAADSTLTAGDISVAVQRPSSLYYDRYTEIIPVASSMLAQIGGLSTGAGMCSSGPSGSYSRDGAGLAQAASDMAGWSGAAYLWGGGHGSLDDLQNRLSHQFAGGRVVPVSETPAGDTDPGSTPNEFGVDCSGFVRAVVWQVTGVDVGGWTSDPASYPDITSRYWVQVDEWSAQPGDVFFTGGHTGFVMSDAASMLTYETVSARNVDLGIGQATYTKGRSGVTGVYRFTGGDSPGDSE